MENETGCTAEEMALLRDWVGDATRDHEDAQQADSTTIVRWVDTHFPGGSSALLIELQ